MLKLDSIVQITNQTERYQELKLKQVIELMKDKLGGKMMIKFAVLRPKTYSYLTNDSDANRKAKCAKCKIPVFNYKTLRCRLKAL